MALLIMTEEEIEYTLKKIKEALAGKKYPATPQLFAKLNKMADEKQRKSDDIQGKTKNMV